MKALIAALSFVILASVAASGARAETRTFTTVAVEINGTKFWIPANFTVKKGDTVKIHALNKVPGANNVHGFAIDAFKVQEIVGAKGKEYPAKIRVQGPETPFQFKLPEEPLEVVFNKNGDILARDVLVNKSW